MLVFLPMVELAIPCSDPVRRIGVAVKGELNPTLMLLPAMPAYMGLLIWSGAYALAVVGETMPLTPTADGGDMELEDQALPWEGRGCGVPARRGWCGYIL
jgi:hypothetical protein